MKRCQLWKPLHPAVFLAPKVSQLKTTKNFSTGSRNNLSDDSPSDHKSRRIQSSKISSSKNTRSLRFRRSSFSWSDVENCSTECRERCSTGWSESQLRSFFLPNTFFIVQTTTNSFLPILIIIVPFLPCVTNIKQPWYETRISFKNSGELISNLILWY